MVSTLSERLLRVDGLADCDRDALLRTARRLRRGPSRLLAGRHVAIAGEGDDAEAAALFERAATGLGARVSRIAPDLLFQDDPADEIPAARLLARLYDAVDCPQGRADRALQLQRQSGVPVFQALGGARHPIRALLEDGEGEDALVSLVQAVLVETLA